jgi:hypothetical protein
MEIRRRHLHLVSTISKLADRADVPATTLRFYEQQGCCRRNVPLPATDSMTTTLWTGWRSSPPATTWACRCRRSKTC